MVSLESLYDALLLLQCADTPLARQYDPQWRLVERWLRTQFPGGGAAGEEARQETMLALTRAVGAMKATAPKQAAKWIGTIHRNKVRDEHRKGRREPASASLDAREDLPPTVDTLGADDERTLEGATLERLLEILEEQVERYLARAERSPDVRHLRRQQARATLHRVVAEADVDELRALLDGGSDLTRDRIYKWVERGRAVVLAAMDDWLARDGDGAVDVVRVVRELVEARRADAGRARGPREST